MTLPTQTEIDRALHDHVTEVDGAWYFPGPREIGHSEDDARGIVAACLILGTAITDTIPSKAWYGLVERVARLEERLG